MARSKTVWLPQSPVLISPLAYTDITMTCFHTDTCWPKHATPQANQKRTNLALTDPFSTGQKTCVTPLRSGFFVQWKHVYSPFTPGSIDPAVNAGFSHLDLDVNVNVRSGCISGTEQDFHI